MTCIIVLFKYQTDSTHHLKIFSILVSYKVQPSSRFLAHPKMGNFNLMAVKPKTILELFSVIFTRS